MTEPRWCRCAGQTLITTETAVAITVNGRNNMPSFRDAYSVDELYDVVGYIVDRLEGGR